MKEAFRRIMSLPLQESDNKQRVKRILEHFYITDRNGRKVLDVGSGLGVFPAAMASRGWECTAVDPDPVAVEFVRKEGIRGFIGEFLKVEIEDTFDLITFNRVLEHVRDMVPMLRKAQQLLEPSGLIYVEVPDAQAAIRSAEGIFRQEFFIEHFCAPTPTSLGLLLGQSGLEPELLETGREPSGKFSIRAFAQLIERM